MPPPNTSLVNPWNIALIDVIKEEVLNENNPSSFDNNSSALNLDQSRPYLASLHTSKERTKHRESGASQSVGTEDIEA